MPGTNKAYPARITLDVSEEALAALDAARLADGVDTNPRLRALITAWTRDSELQEFARVTGRQDKRVGRPRRVGPASAPPASDS